MHAPQSNPRPSSDLPERTPQKAQNPRLIVTPLVAALAIIGCSPNNSPTNGDAPSEPATPRVFTDPEFSYGYWKLICQDGTGVSLDFEPGQFWGSARVVSSENARGNNSAGVELTAYEAIILEEAIQNGDIVDEKSLELFLLDLAMDQTLKPRKFDFAHFDMERPECAGGRQEVAREMDSTAWDYRSDGIVDGALSLRERQWIDNESFFGLLAVNSWADIDWDGSTDSLGLGDGSAYGWSMNLARSLGPVEAAWLDTEIMPRTGAAAQAWLSTIPPCITEGWMEN